MKIKGDKIRDDEELLRGRLYRLESSRVVVFKEKDTKDTVNLNFVILDGQYGIYGEEYKPPFIESRGEKKADILAFVIDDVRKCFSSWIFDVKKTVGGEDVIYHLVEQLSESCRHKKSIATYLEDYMQEEHIGYITHDLQKERIEEVVYKKKIYLRKEQEKIKGMPVLVGAAANMKFLKEEARLNVLTAFLKDYIIVGEKKYHLEHFISTEHEGNYICSIDIQCS